MVSKTPIGPANCKPHVVGCCPKLSVYPTTQRPPRPCATSPPPRARPSGGRSAAIPPQHGRTRAGSKLPAGPQRGAAHHRQPQKGAERAFDLPTVKIQVAFLSSDGEFG